MTPLLRLKDLRVQFKIKNTTVTAVDGVSLAVKAGDSLAIVGETGSGKTTLARALMGLHPSGSVSGTIELDGSDLTQFTEKQWQAVRWQRMGLSVQNAATAFDPVIRVGHQIVEPMLHHLAIDKGSAWQRTIALVAQMGLTPDHLHAFPHQLSGGEQQRLVLAMALSCQPDLLILDEPTSGQDSRARAQLVELLQKIRVETGVSLLFISHDLAAVAALSDQVAVMYAGKLVEVATTRDWLHDPQHPYSVGLFGAYPDMTTTRDLQHIRGHMSDPANPPTGCRFHPRCTQVIDDCRTLEPPLEPQQARLLACHLGGLQTLLSARHVSKTFKGNGGPRTRGIVHAVDDASMHIREGEVVALVGETGSGKSTLGRLLVGLLSADSGTILFEGIDLATTSPTNLKHARRRIQLVPQNPFDSVDPLWTVLQVVREPLDIQRTTDRTSREQLVCETLTAVGLPNHDVFLHQRVSDLSGGQLQRVVIARALVLQPKLLIADEPVSMLDPSEQARLMILLKTIQNERGMGLLIISHDLALVRKIADRILVIEQGRIVESGRANVVIGRPKHTYTQALIAAAPAFDWVATEQHVAAASQQSTFITHSIEEHQQ